MALTTRGDQMTAECYSFQQLDQIPNGISPNSGQDLIAPLTSTENPGTLIDFRVSYSSSFILPVTVQASVPNSRQGTKIRSAYQKIREIHPNLIKRHRCDFLGE